MKVQDAVSIATKEIGTCEHPANSNNVKYNTWYYGKEVSGAQYPWCAVFISWVFKDNPTLCKRTASCADMLEWFERNGQLVKRPQIGDIVFFKYSTNNRRTNHVGLVIGVSGNTITTVEGNTSQTSQDNGGKVMKRVRKTSIVAYARPKYESQELKPLSEVALEVINGEWGNGNDRRQRLTRAGYDFNKVQAEVNRLLST